METTFVFKITEVAALPIPDDPVKPEPMPETNSESMSEAQTLDQIPKGQIARVLGVLGDDPIALRLGDLGIRKGVQIEVLRRAPMGDPTVYEVCNYQLCLRRSESARVQVRALSESPASRAEPGST